MIRYEKLGYVQLNVSDLERSRRFYQDIVGLEFVEKRSDNSIVFRCDDAETRSVILYQKQPVGFKSVGWMIEDDSQFEVLHRRLRDNNVRFEELSLGECDLRQAVRVTRAVEPYSHASLEFFTQRKAGAQRPFKVTHTKIQRLGHVVWSTPKKAQSINFFHDVLNFKESDSIGEATTFMRPFPNPYHHGIGIATSPKPVFHHLNFMVSEIDDIGKAQNRLNQNGVPIVFGPGRHPASTSVFLYFLEPDGMTLEYSFGMEEFTEADPRVPRKLPRIPESLDAWGSRRDPRMGQVGEIEEAQIRASA